jgi:glucoselysine-6-phosphate deglycase
MKPTVLGHIHEQPSRLQSLFAARDQFLEPFLHSLEGRTIKKILLFGSGTSYNAALMGEYDFRHLADTDAKAYYPTVFLNYEKADWTHAYAKSDMLFLGISQSGTSRSTIQVMKWAKENGYPTVVLTGNPNSEICAYAQCVLPLLVGPEPTPPETKGYTCTILTLFLMAAALARKNKVISGREYQDEMDAVHTLVTSYQTALDEATAWYDVHKGSLLNSSRIFVLGYGIDYASALEGQLKIGEMLRIPTLAYELEEFAHGPVMGLDGKQTILIIASDEAEYARMHEFETAFRKYTPRVYLFSLHGQDVHDGNLVFTTKTNKFLAPLLYTLPLQVIAAQGAKDVDIDTGINPFQEPLAHTDA